MSDMILQVNHLRKSFGTHEVLRDIDFTGTGGTDDGGYVALVDGKINVPENLMGAEGLRQMVDL